MPLVQYYDATFYDVTFMVIFVVSFWCVLIPPSVYDRDPGVSVSGNVYTIQ